MGQFCEILDSGKPVVCAGDVLIMGHLLLEPPVETTMNAESWSFRILSLLLCFH
jgi:hypothetical protein